MRGASRHGHGERRCEDLGGGNGDGEGTTSELGIWTLQIGDFVYLVFALFTNKPPDMAILRGSGCRPPARRVYARDTPKSDRIFTSTQIQVP